MENVNVMNIDGNIVGDVCNGEVLSNGVIGEEGVGGDADEGDGVMNEIISPPPPVSPRRSLRTAAWCGSGRSLFVVGVVGKIPVYMV